MAVLAVVVPAAMASDPRDTRNTLERYARDTWASFVAMTDAETGLPADSLHRDGTRSVQTSITNIGARPTVDRSGRTTTETHLFGFDRDLYGATLRVGFVQRLRDEKKFDGIEALKAQIAEDCAAARTILC